jgi:GNAT superfamily N-acetyltransferase
VEIRRLDHATAEGAAELFRELQPSVITTASFLLHRDTAMPERARRLSLVAVDGGSVVGWGSANLKWQGGPLSDARVWVAVSPSHRRLGLGTELADRVEGHAVDSGATRIDTLVENDPAGAEFASGRGYRKSGAEVISKLQPHAVETPELPGFEVVTLADLAGAERELFELWLEAGAYPALGEEPVFDEWRRTVLESPLLEPLGSFTLLDREHRPVSLAWLLVDHERRQAENEWTATLPRLRGQGLAKVVKLHTIRWAAENGIREILTASDEDNIAMLELNRSLGYRRLWRQRSFRRDV